MRGGKQGLRAFDRAAAIRNTLLQRNGDNVKPCLLRCRLGIFRSQKLVLYVILP